MTIKLESTPNPLSYQFSSETPFVEYGHHAFYEPADAQNCLLAQEVLAFDEVAHILITPLFITITVHDSSAWPNIQEKMSSLIKQYVQSGTALIDLTSTAHTQDHDALWQQVDKLIEEHVTPSIASHGGFIKLDRIEDNIVYLELQGACDGCPSSLITLKSGIENLLKFYIPTIKEVQATNLKE